MKLSFSKPAEPHCTIKMDLQEARVLYAVLTGEVVDGWDGAIGEMRCELAGALAKELGIVREGSLFREEKE